MKKFIECHLFFVRTSATFVAPFTLKTYLRYPIAYVKFMYYSFFDNN